MDCPAGHPALRERRLADIRVDSCDTCGGTWYDRDELRLLKDRGSEGAYRWLDVDLWKDPSGFRHGGALKLRCPRDRSALVAVKYGDTSVTVDVCEKCHGVWLEQSEFEAILRQLRERVHSATSEDFLRDLRDELREVLTGPEGPASELADVATVASLLQLRFVIEHPTLLTAIQHLPKV